MNDYSKELVGDFLKSVQFNLLPLENQRIVKVDQFAIPEDWLAIELAKILYIGESNYLYEEPPRRLLALNNFEKKSIVNLFESKKTLAEKSFSKFVILNPGRGFDILLIKTINSSHNEIFCHDCDLRYTKLIYSFFGNFVGFINNDYLSEFLEKTNKEVNTCVIRNEEL